MVDIEGVLFIQGRKIAPGATTDKEESIHKQEKHWVFKQRQETSFCVPIVTPHSALGVAVAETLHE